MSAQGRVPTDPRISRRRRSVARSKRKKVATGLTAVAAAGGIAWGALASPLLAVDNVKVIGGKHTTAAEIARAAGLDENDNLLLLSADAVERSAETLPWVKEAEVARVLPGTVRVRVTERIPAMVVSLGAALWTIDARGHVLDAGAISSDLPTLGGTETGDIEIGSQISTPEIQDALAAFRSLSGKLQERVVAVIAPTSERISFSLDDGTLIRFGAAERLAAKNQVLGALLTRLRQQGRSAAYIDVRVPTSPAVAPRTTVATPAPTPST